MSSETSTAVAPQSAATQKPKQVDPDVTTPIVNAMIDAVIARLKSTSPFPDNAAAGEEVRALFKVDDSNVDVTIREIACFKIACILIAKLNECETMVVNEQAFIVFKSAMEILCKIAEYRTEDQPVVIFLRERRAVTLLTRAVDSLSKVNGVINDVTRSVYIRKLRQVQQRAVNDTFRALLDAIR